MAEVLDSSERSARALPQLAVVLAAVVLCTTTYIGLFDHSLSWGNGCGDDGLFYCNLVRGVQAGRPWSRRILLPLFVRVLHVPPASTVQAFLVINLLAIVGMAGLTALLTLRLSRRLGADPGRARWGAVVAACVILLMPMGVKWTVFYPALVDPFSSLLAVLWFTLFTALRPTLRWSAGVVAFAAEVDPIVRTTLGSR